MLKISEKRLKKITSLIFNITLEEVEEFYTLSQDKITFSRQMKQQELLMSVHISVKNQLDKGYHACIMKNGDVFCRTSPYYDCYEDGLIIVNNQREIFKIVIDDILICQ